MPSKKKTRTSSPRSIYEDTGIILEAVVERVVGEANYLLKVNIEEAVCSDVFGYLTGYAEALYANNSNFRKKVRSEANHGNAGRDYLYSFMRHWLASKILKDCHSDNLPRFRRILETSEFSMGREIRR